jgi:hypothetical protein
MTRTLLAVDALVFAVFALAFLIVPRTAMSLVGIGALSPGGVVDVRAIYGGFQLGVALYLAVCAVVPALGRPGLIAATICLSTTAATRLLAMLVDSPLDPTMGLILALETGGALLNGWLLSTKRI